MTLSAQAREILLELAGLPGEDQARIIKMLMLFSQVPGDVEVRAWEMLVRLVENSHGRGEVLASIDRVASYLEASLDTAAEPVA